MAYAAGRIVADRVSAARLYRLDAGHRASLRVERMGVHLDLRQRMTGTVLPGSVAVVTIGGDF
ncbi:hypothetical protein [Sphingomonas xanthus]|uniref:Uncharacterized protein n=1 Tax=Sphingomonas xanthus TaxID=2594473 RepID=A0A516IRD3_9SPHN|nr:hypothetical protein [Sphingomonas xanthus]QDP19477.1 hypothetical protein FMM02_05575 [Sphingomonas xanthus]